MSIQQLRLLHFLLMFVFGAFTIHHVYSAILVDIEERNGEVSSIVTGYKARRARRTSSHERRATWSVIGVGNVVLSDDGLGVHAVRRLAERHDVAGVEIVEGGTAGLLLLPCLADARRAIVVDAIDTGAAPGTLVRLEGGDLDRGLATVSTVHDVGLADLLGAARISGAWPEELVLHGAQPGSTAVGAELTAPLAACLDRLVDRVASDLARWGATPAPRRLRAVVALHDPPQARAVLALELLEGQLQRTQGLLVSRDPVALDRVAPQPRGVQRRVDAPQRRFGRSDLHRGLQRPAVGHGRRQQRRVAAELHQLRFAIGRDRRFARAGDAEDRAPAHGDLRAAGPRPPRG